MVLEQSLQMIFDRGVRTLRNSSWAPGFVKDTRSGRMPPFLPEVTIGRWGMVGAGTVVTQNVPAFALVTGKTSRLTGWVCRCGQKLGGAI